MEDKLKKSGEAVKLGSPPKPENKNNQFLEPTKINKQ
jgi:hypothetical protein